jgi:hypothetical protein
MASKTLKPLFMAEPDVIKFGIPRLRKGKNRGYVSMRIPESAARRVYRRLTGKEILPIGRA